MSYGGLIALEEEHLGYLRAGDAVLFGEYGLGGNLVEAEVAENPSDKKVSVRLLADYAGKGGAILDNNRTLAKPEQIVVIRGRLHYWMNVARKTT
jgi:hypothetical protein